MNAYGRLLAIPEARNILLLGMLLRIPVFAAGLVLTLHVVSALGRSYAEAGVVTTLVTVATAISAPWRGRLLDRSGLRRTLLPSLVLLPVCWSVAPFVGYWPLLPLAFLGSLFTVPSFSIVRQILIGSVPEAQRKTALALESVVVEVSFMLGPLLGVLAATYWSTVWSLLTFQLLAVLGGVALWLLNPALPGNETGTADGGPRVRLREWMSPVTLALLIAALTSTVVLTGGDLGTVAAMRAMGRPQDLGWVLVLWGVGSAVGGLIYGVMRRSWSAFVLVGLLGLVTLPVALAEGPVGFAVLMAVSGLLCAPTVTATLDHLSRVIPARVRGEALGWHGAALTAGSGLGAPLIGAAIDGGGWPAGFVVAGVAGIVVGVSGQALVLLRRSRRGERSRAPVAGR